MTPHRHVFTEFRELANPSMIYMGDNTRIQALGVGKVPFIMDNGAEGTIKGVLYVPKLSKSLLSVSAFDQEGFLIEFKDGNCIIERNGSMIARGLREGGLYKLTSTIGCVDRSTLAIEGEKAITWHKRLGHLDVSGMKEMISKGLVKGFNVTENLDSVICRGCVLGKMKRMPFQSVEGRRSKDLLELLHINLCGPIAHESLGHARYFKLIIDDFSRKTFVYFLTQKNEALNKIKAFKSEVENQIGKRIKRVKTDNGGGV